MMNLEDMEKRLISEFPDASVKIGDMTGGGDHIQLEIATKAFEGLSRIKQHQKIMDVFAEELKTGQLHALSIQSKTK